MQLAAFLLSYLSFIGLIDTVAKDDAKRRIYRLIFEKTAKSIRPAHPQSEPSERKQAFAFIVAQTISRPDHIPIMFVLFFVTTGVAFAFNGTVAPPAFTSSAAFFTTFLSALFATCLFFVGETIRAIVLDKQEGGSNRGIWNAIKAFAVSLLAGAFSMLAAYVAIGLLLYLVVPLFPFNGILYQISLDTALALYIIFLMYGVLLLQSGYLASRCILRSYAAIRMRYRRTHTTSPEPTQEKTSQRTMHFGYLNWEKHPILALGFLSAIPIALVWGVIIVYLKP